MFKRTDEQQAIADHVAIIQGNIALNAGAGSGKTTMALDLIANVIPARDSVLYCAFNKKIQVATEAKLNAIPGRTGARGYSNATAKTFNGIAYGAFMSRKQIKSAVIKMDEQKYLKLASDWVQEHMQHLKDDEKDMAIEIIDRLIHFARVNTTYERSRYRALFVLSDKEEDGKAIYTPLNDPYFDGAEALLAKLAIKYNLFGQLDDYEDERRLCKAVAPLLRKGKAMMDEPDDEGKYICTFTDQVYWMIVEEWKVWRNKYVIIDESQDLSPVFRALVDLCVDVNTGHVIIIGDPQQAIYSFTGADNDGFQNSVAFWDARHVFPLTISWRCPTKVAELAREWKTDFQAAPNAIEGVVADVSEEAMIRDAQSGDAIISRTRGPMIPTWQKLVGAGKPAIIVGNDVSKQIIRVLERVAKQKGFQFSELHAALILYSAKQIAKMTAKKKPQDEIDNFIDQMEAVKGAVDAVEADSMEELTRKIRAIFAKNDEEIDETQAVIIMTGHASKGLEFNTVYILTPTLFPFKHPGQTRDQQIQEMNLQYVVRTRAMQKLLHVTTKKEAAEKKEDPTPPTIEPVVEPEITIIEPSYLRDDVALLIEACIDYRNHIGNPLQSMERLQYLAKLAESIRNVRPQETTALDRELQVG